MNKHLTRGLVAAGSLIAAGAARAADAGPDISAITTAATTVAGIGGAVFLVMVGIKVFKWAQRAL